MSAHPFGVSSNTRTDPVRVLEDMKRLAVEQLGSLPGRLYQPIETPLPSPAARVESLHDQAALLILRQHSASHVMRFRQQIALGFEDVQAPRQRDSAPLELLDEQLLEFHLAGQRLGELLDQRYQLALDEMRGRLGALAVALQRPPGPNPVAPARLAMAFIEVIGDADLPRELGALLFQRYQQELVRVLDELYPRINQLLASAGFGIREVAHRFAPMQAENRAFPDDEQVTPRDRAPAAQPAVSPVPAAVPHVVAPVASQAAPVASQPLVRRRLDELDGLREQLHAWRNDVEHLQPAIGLHAVAPPRAPVRRELGVHEVKSIASLLQAESPDAYSRALVTPGRLAQVIRNQLTEGARRLGLNPDQTRFSVEEEDSIDLVAMLFETLFRTHSLQERARRLYARLVLPYVKVALHDDAVFVRAGHPARRLLDAITEACEGNQGATAQDRELLERAAAVSQRVVAEFNEDLAVFELAHAELEELLQQQRRRVEMQVDRAAKATYGRERLADARGQADRLVERRLAAPPITQAVADFLITPWRHHLVQTLLRDGAESARYADATRLGDALVNADRLAAAVRGRDLADCLLTLEPAIVQCLGTSGLDDSAARHGMAWLVNGLANPDAPRLFHELPSRGPEEGGDDEARLWLAGGTDTLEYDSGVASLMRRLKPGAWLRMVDPQGEANAVKVAWVSPLTSRLLLVNRRGLRVLVASAEELARLVAAGRLMVGAESTPCDEAMRQLRERLDHAVGQR